MTWVTSDWHFNHDREFIWKARGFNSVQEMNEAIIQRHNILVRPNDTVYVLGDLMLGPNKEAGLQLIKRLNGDIVVIAGNHDTEARKELYRGTGWPVYDALSFKEAGYQFYLSHYPTMTANLESESLRQCVLNLYGHTHQTSCFYNDIPFMYHVGMDSHDCCPTNLEQIIEDMRYKVIECKDML